MLLRPCVLGVLAGVLPTGTLTISIARRLAACTLTRHWAGATLMALCAAGKQAVEAGCTPCTGRGGHSSMAAPCTCCTAAPLH